MITAVAHGNHVVMLGAYRATRGMGEDPMAHRMIWHFLLGESG